ncbi:MAG: triose-phosphate isomerase [Eggerthellaceae bacterium]|nr:triose-phosphate isomerase [Eggerthellaceae bacterium]
MTRKPLMVANWKMNNTLGQSVVLAQEISNRFNSGYEDKVDVVICPPYIGIKPVKTVFDFDKCKISLGAQNVFYEKSGAYTGEISVEMLSELGCMYCIVGHSERREYFGETNNDVNRKAKALISGKIKPIICVGESLYVRENADPQAFVLAQIDAAFAGMDAFEAKECCIAYEPVWAIGTGRTATPEVAGEMCRSIRVKIAELFGDDIASNMRILYGGSVNVGNIDALIAQEDIDGALIGNASLQADSFASLFKACL